MYDLPIGNCGMPCALCPQYRINGASRCIGCSQDGGYTGSCKLHKCCNEKEILSCGLCESCHLGQCEKWNKLKEFKDFDTHKVWERNCTQIKEIGFEAWYKEYAEKAELLTIALDQYNDDHMKKYLCQLFVTQELATLRTIMKEAQEIGEGTKKEKGAYFKELVSKRA